MFKVIRKEYEIQTYFLGVKIRKEHDFKAFYFCTMDKLEEIKKEIYKTEEEIGNVKNIQQWQNYALSRLNYGQNVIFKYNSGMPICSENFSYERVIAFDINDAPADHRERYLFANNFINENDKVLDIACGTGYGTAYFAKTAKKVVGVDVDKYAINFANKIFVEREEIKNLSFKCADVFEDKLGKFDKIISFETIEHLENDELFISKLFDALEDGGKLICSTPNETVFPFKKEENQYHIRHYTVEDLTKLLTSAGFVVEEIYFQYHEENERVLKRQDNEGYTVVCIARKG